MDGAFELQKIARQPAAVPELLQEKVIAFYPGVVSTKELTPELDRLPPGMYEKLMPMLEALHTHIQKPILVDTFGNDHDARRAWEAGIVHRNPDYKTLFDNNKMGGNSNPIGLVSVIREVCGDSAADLPELPERVMSQVESNTWAALSDEEKRNILIVLDAYFEKVLTYFTDYIPQEGN